LTFSNVSQFNLDEENGVFLTYHHHVGSKFVCTFLIRVLGPVALGFRVLGPVVLGFRVLGPVVLGFRVLSPVGLGFRVWLY
jgi:hypothetical protein